jgi:hypothetical protein
MVIGLLDFLVWLQNYGQSLVWDLVFIFFFHLIPETYFLDVFRFLTSHCMIHNLMH